MTIRPDERLLVIFDYDGTITLDDCNSVVLQQAVGDAWRESELAMERGEISPDDAFRRQIALLRLERRELLDLAVGAATVRPGFGAFLRDLVDGGARVAVVSAGFRETIEAVWEREGLPPVELYTSELLGDPQRGYEVGFHAFAAACGRCDHCKGRVVRRIRAEARRLIVFGDGDNDLCMARQADVVFARRRLAVLCRQHGIPHRCFEDYTDVLETMAVAS